MTINDSNWQFLQNATGLSLPFNQMYFKYLRSLGYTGTLQDMIAKSGLGMNPSGLKNPANPRPLGLERLFANGENGFLFDPMSDLTRLFTTSTGPTQVAANDDPVGLMLDRSKWAGKTMTQVLAEQTEMLVAGSWIMSVAGGTSTAVESPSGTLTLIPDGVNSARGEQAITTVVGRTYRVRATVSTSACAVIVGTTSGGSNILSTTAGIGTFDFFFVASTTTTYIGFIKTSAATCIISAISCKGLTGNHAVRAGSDPLRPLWKANSNKPFIIPTAGDSALITPFIPTPALTMAIAVRFPTTNTNNYLIMGGGVSAGNKRAFIGKNATTGTVAVGWGDESLGHTIVGPDLGETDHVIVVTGDASAREIWLDGTLIHTRVPTLSPDGTGGGIALGYYNNGGSPSTPSQSRIYAALAMNRRAMSGEIARITTQFQQRF